MENRYFIKKCFLLPSDPVGSLKETFILDLGNPSITYVESLKSPSISMTITFLDVDGVVSREGLTAGESIDLSIKVPGFPEFEIKPYKHNLVLNGISDVTTFANKPEATLEFVTKESIQNETARITQKFHGTPPETCREILKSSERGIKTNKTLETDKSGNRYPFCGNFKRPFEIIQWLCPKTIPDKGYGFVFYETREGYFFKSIDKLLEEESIVYKKPEIATDDDFKIIECQVNSTNDIGMNMRMGMYANKTIYVNLDTPKGTTGTVEDFKISSLGLKKSPKIPDNLQENPSRLMFRLLDTACMQKGSKKEDQLDNKELAIYQNKAYARNNLLLSQSVSISIPFNPELSVGKMMEIQLPFKKVEGSDTARYGDDTTNDISGKYLIFELKHIIGGGKAHTFLQLIRDTFTA